MRLFEEGISDLLTGWGYRLKSYYLRSEVQRILETARKEFPGRFAAREVPSSTYYKWLQACYIEASPQLSYEDVEKLISFLLHLNARGNKKTFTELLIEKERQQYDRQQYENQNRTASAPRTIEVTARKCV